MQVNLTSQFQRTRKKYFKNDIALNEKIDSTIELLKQDYLNHSLHYKKINCKKDKKRHSIRIPSTQYRILMTVHEDLTELICICDHDEYNMFNKNC